VPAKLIVGLGNPGERYAMTRHNAGFMAIDKVARLHRFPKWRRDCESLVCSGEIAGAPALLAKPLTFMNLSGQAVKLLLAGHGLELNDLVIVLDDLNLPFGTVRVRKRGSSGGHLGLESVITRLGTEEVPRIRLGIGEENIPADKAEFVLSDFRPDQEMKVEEMIARASDAVATIVTQGTEKAMSLFNAQEKEKEL